MRGVFRDCTPLFRYPAKRLIKSPTCEMVSFMYLGSGFVGDVPIGLELLVLAFPALGSSALVDKCRVLNILGGVQEGGLVDVL